jgi:hypothetical protein
MSAFLNQVMLGEERLHACREGAPVTYIRNSRSNMEKIVIYHIKKILAEGDLASDVFILGPSVKGAMSNIRKMENFLVEGGVPCHVPMMESDRIDERVIEGKVVFSTFHAVKGRQRKYVFVVGFDQTYFSIYARTLPRDRCPNTLYVACTRATHAMYLLENDQYATDRPLEFLKQTHHEMKQSEYTEFKGNPQTKFWQRDDVADKEDTECTYQVTPTDLIRFVPEDVLETISPLVMRMFQKQLSETGFTEEEMPSVVRFANGFYEDVSDLNGIAIPCMFYDHLQKSKQKTPQQNALHQLIKSFYDDMKPHEHGFLRNIFKGLDPTCTSISDYLYMSNVYSAFQEGLYFKLKQIKSTEYTWLSNPVMTKCMHILETVIGDPAYICQEQTIIHYQMEAEHAVIDQVLETELACSYKFRFHARCDLVSDHDVWELKCTSHLSIDHMLQVVIYAWIWAMVYPDQPKTFRLFNIKTAEHLKLVATTEELTQVVAALLKSKYVSNHAPDDSEFVSKNVEQ